MLMIRLHRALLKDGIESEVFTRNLAKGGDGIRCLEYSQNRYRRLVERAAFSVENRMNRLSAASSYSRMHLPYKTPVPKNNADIIHLHWISHWLDLPSFVSSLPNKTPIVWTVHDMSALAGGCYTDFGCDQFGKNCNLCPLLKFPANHLFARQELKRRRASLSGRKIAFVSNSISTASLVERSQLTKDAKHVTILPGFDFSEFQVISKSEAKMRLGISDDAFTLGFVAASLTDRNKGINRFFDVAAKVKKRIPQTQALVVGEGIVDVMTEQAVPCSYLGTINDSEMMNLSYSAMDALVICSQMESFGQVSVEAQACGTPVYGFSVGGLPETILQGRTGVMVPYYEVEVISECIIEGKSSGELLAMGMMGASWVRSQFDISNMAFRYMELYRSLLDEEKTGTLAV